MANQKLNIDIIARDKTKQALGNVQGALGKLRSAVFNLQSAFVGLGAGLVIRNLVNTGKELENLQVRLKFLLKDTNEGAKAFDNMVKFASKVPFSLEEIQSGSGILATVTDNAKDLQKMLEITGNVAAVTGLDFRTTAEQIQRSFSSGIGSADLFRERGVRALLGFKAGAEVTIEDTKKRFRELFGPGGEFEKATEVLSTTFTGTLSMLSDKLFKFRLETGQAGFFDFIKQGLVEVNKLIEANSELLAVFGAKLSNALITATKQIILGSAVIIQALRPVFSFIGSSLLGLFDFLRTLPEGVRTLGIVGFLMLGGKGKALILLIGGFIDEVRSMLGDLLMGFAEFNQKILEIRKTLRLVSDEDFVKILNQNNQLVGIATNLKKPVNDFRKEIEATNGGLDTTVGKLRQFLNTLEAKALISKQQIEEILSRLKGATDETDKTAINFGKVADTIKNQIKKDLESVNQTIGKFILGGVKSFSRALAESVVLGKKLNMTLKELAQKLLVDILAFTIQLIIQKQIEVFLTDMSLKKEKEKLDVLREQQRELRKNNKQSLISTALAFLPGMASGGAVGKGRPVMVGERGPELFIPNSSGQITQNARGMGGRSAVVNFNINTIDSRGFDQALIENRGTITAIINNALTEKGRGELI